MKAANLPTRGLALLPFADHIYDTCAAFFAGAGRALPDRHYIASGLPSLSAWDCEQFVVGVSGIVAASSTGNAPQVSPRSGTPVSAMTKRAVTYLIQLVRCVDGAVVGNYGNPPDVALMNTGGRQQLIEMGLLTQALLNTCSSLPPWLSDAGANVGEVTPIGPDGAYYGIEATVTIGAFDLMTGTETP